VLGAITCAPLILVWSSSRAGVAQRSKLEVALLWLAVGIGALLVLDSMLPFGGKVYILYPVLIWSALRFEQRGSTTTTFLISALAIAATATGTSPFVQGSLSESLLGLQSFMGITTGTMLILAAAVSERDRAAAAATRSKEAADFLLNAERILSSSLDFETTLESVARLVIPRLGDNCVMDVVNPDGTLRRVAEVSIDPEKEALLRQLRKFPVGAHRQSPAVTVLQTGKTVFIPRFDEAALTQLEAVDEYAALVRKIAPRSSLTVPLSTMTKVVGVLTFGMSDSGREYQPEDIVLAEDLGRRAGLAVKNSRLYLEAKEAIQGRDDFLAIASHELRTPLAALHLQLGMLKRSSTKGEPVPPDKLLSKLEVMARQVDRLTTLIEDLLDVSRVLAGRFSFEPEELDLSKLLEEIAGRFVEQSARSKSPIILSGHEQPCVGRWDRLRVDQIVTNLLTNALKYGAGQQIELTLSSHPSPVLTVKDYGIGIRAEDQRRIFERFERAVSRQHFGGIGLGLWIVKQIVNGMGGEISLQSEPGSGSRFTVSLPSGTLALK
jgi:signal transduction histidine kinase